jgi:hypothetical protein
MHDVFAGDHHDRRRKSAKGKEKEKEVHQYFPSLNAAKSRATIA